MIWILYDQLVLSLLISDCPYQHTCSILFLFFIVLSENILLQDIEKQEEDKLKIKYPAGNPTVLLKLLTFKKSFEICTFLLLKVIIM